MVYLLKEETDHGLPLEKNRLIKVYRPICRGGGFRQTGLLKEQTDHGLQACMQARTRPPSWANYFKIMQFSPETEFTPLKIRIHTPFVKTLFQRNAYGSGLHCL